MDRKAIFVGAKISLWHSGDTEGRIIEITPWLNNAYCQWDKDDHSHLYGMDTVTIYRENYLRMKLKNHTERVKKAHKNCKCKKCGGIRLMLKEAPC